VPDGADAEEPRIAALEALTEAISGSRETPVAEPV
jgi:hypothetical protein